MLSPARRHLEQHMARKAHGQGSARPGTAPAMPTGTAAAQEYRLLQVALTTDRYALKQIQSLEAKIERKRDLLPRYLPWLEGALDSDTAAQDDIVTTMLVWSIDVADWPLAVRLADHVITHRLELPEQYKRTPGCLIAEEFAEAGLLASATNDGGYLMRVEQLTENSDMPDEVRAKLKKAIGLAIKTKIDAFDRDADVALAGQLPAAIEAALRYFQRALELDPKCGVKKLIEQLQRAIKKLSEEPLA